MLKIGTNKLSTFIAVIGLLIFLHFIKILAPVELFVVDILNPVLSHFYSVGSFARIAYDGQASKEDLAARVKELENQTVKLTVESAKLAKLEAENEILRQNLKFFNNRKQNYVLSNIISRGSINNLTAQNSAVIINKGSKDGLSPGLAVVSGKGVVIGKVISVKSSLAEIYLTVNPFCKFAVAMQNQDKTIGVARGELGLTAIMEFIPQTEKINIGDIVITSGLEQNIPRGLIIGKVSQVKKESNEIWQSAVIEPLVDLNELIIVSVLLP